jgi:hypothetical protein
VRRRRPPERVREALAAEDRRLAALYDPTGFYGLTRRAEALEAGESVEAYAYEVDLLPPMDRVRIESDGSIVRVGS